MTIVMAMKSKPASTPASCEKGPATETMSNPVDKQIP